MGFSVILTEKGGDIRRFDFEAEEITIGRLDENDICLPKGNVSKRHTRIAWKDGEIVVLDLKSTNGTYVNGKRLNGAQVVQPWDRIYIGDFVLHVEPPDPLNLSGGTLAPGATAAPEDEEGKTPKPPIAGAEPGPAAAAPPAPEPQPAGAAPAAAPPPAKAAVAPVPAAGEKPPTAPIPAAAGEKPPTAPISAAAGPKPPTAPIPPPRPGQLAAGRRGQILRTVHDRLIEALDLRRLDVDALGGGELRKKAEAATRAIVEKMEEAKELDPQLDKKELVQDVLNEALGLGPLEIYLHDDSVAEIMVNAPTQVYVERDGKLERADKVFSSAQAVLGVIERIVAPLGRHIDESSPLVDARLADGSRVNAIIPPLALKGPCITIRKFRRGSFDADALVQRGTFTRSMAGFLAACVRARRNIAISGGTGSGKTTLLNVLAGFIPPDERVVTIEDAAELQLPQENWVSLEARPGNIEGKGQVGIRELVRNSLRMRPDRIVVGECRGGEALDMLQAMNTGHDGSLTTLHANSPRDALSRLETLVLMAGMDLPSRAIREQIGSALHLLVQVTRFADGSRRVAAISEVAGLEQDAVALQDVFQFKQEGFDAEGRVAGRFVATGYVPRFYEELQRRGIPVDMGIFREG